MVVERQERQTRALLREFTLGELTSQPTQKEREVAEQLRQKAIDLLKNWGQIPFHWFNLEEEIPDLLPTGLEQSSQEPRKNIMTRLVGRFNVLALVAAAEPYRRAREVVRATPLREINVPFNGGHLIITSFRPDLLASILTILHSKKVEPTKLIPFTLNDCHVFFTNSGWGEVKPAYILPCEGAPLPEGSITSRNRKGMRQIQAILDFVTNYYLQLNSTFSIHQATPPR